MIEPSDKKHTYEPCPHCGEEVELKAELSVQTCPHCGKRIVTCSMCLACDADENYCSKCCLCFQANVENQEKGRLPIDEIDGILDLFNRSEVDEIDFHGHPKRPTITESGIRYEIVTITPYQDDMIVSLAVAKEHDATELDVFDLDCTWKRTTISRIKRIVDEYLHKQGLL